MKTINNASEASKSRSQSEQVSTSNRVFPAKRGQTLMEALAAISLMILIVTALVGVGIRTIRSATAARNLATATSYAEEGMEALRSIRDRGFGVLATTCTTLSWSGSQWTCAAGTPETLDTIYQRSVAITPDPPASTTKVKAVVNVTWTDTSGLHDVTLTSYFTDWR